MHNSNLRESQYVNKGSESASGVTSFLLLGTIFLFQTKSPNNDKGIYIKMNAPFTQLDLLHLLPILRGFELRIWKMQGVSAKEKNLNQHGSSSKGD